MEQQTTSANIDSKEIHKHSFWLYSVIVGLSVEESLRHVLPHVGEFSFEMDGYQVYRIVLEFIRLALYLCLVVRFYLGSVKFFSVVHVSESSAIDYPTKNYTIDFFFGLIHFSSFLALSLAIDSNQPYTIFLFWLSFILLYDFVWWFACRKYSTRHFVKLWTFLNALTFVISIALFFVSSAIFSYFKAPPKVAEFWCEFFFLLPVIIVSLIDIREVLKSEPIFEKWFKGLLEKKETTNNATQS